jgi:hypothetical protein
MAQLLEHLPSKCNAEKMRGGGGEREGERERERHGKNDLKGDSSGLSLPPQHRAGIQG